MEVTKREWKQSLRVVIPTVYPSDCPTIRSRLYPMCLKLSKKGFSFTFLLAKEKTREISPGIVFKGYRNYWELLKEIFNIDSQSADIILACKPYSITGVPWPLVVRTFWTLGFHFDELSTAHVVRPI